MKYRVIWIFSYDWLRRWYLAVKAFLENLGPDWVFPSFDYFQSLVLPESAKLRSDQTFLDLYHLLVRVLVSSNLAIKISFNQTFFDISKIEILLIDIYSFLVHEVLVLRRNPNILPKNLNILSRFQINNETSFFFKYYINLAFSFLEDMTLHITTVFHRWHSGLLNSFFSINIQLFDYLFPNANFTSDSNKLIYLSYWLQFYFCRNDLN